MGHVEIGMAQCELCRSAQKADLRPDAGQLSTSLVCSLTGHLDDAKSGDLDALQPTLSMPYSAYAHFALYLSLQGPAGAVYLHLFVMQRLDWVAVES